MTDRPYSPEEESRLRLDLRSSASHLSWKNGEETVSHSDDFGGVDIRIYKITDPDSFLATQQNLHRPQMQANYQGESALNVFRVLWNSFYNDVRMVWQRIFSESARKVVTQGHPELKQVQPHTVPLQLRNEPRFRKISGYELQSEFRYPVFSSQPVQAPTDVVLQGSSSDFLGAAEGDTYVPLGKRAPGLYLVEASYGDYAAHTLLFVSNTVLVTKQSSEQFFVYAADSKTGKPQRGVDLKMTDRLAVIAQSVTAEDGTAFIEKKLPDKVYVYAKDPQGGVAISENFYFDSEIYGKKIYLFTDRPLYQPGDSLSVMAFAREFFNAQENKETVFNSTLKLVIVNSLGEIIAERAVNFKGEGEVLGQFDLPENAIPGGYTIELHVGEEIFLGGAFRVQSFVKPHFEARLVFDQDKLSVSQPVYGKIHIRTLQGKALLGGSARVIVFKKNLSLTAQSSGGLARTMLFDKVFSADENGDISLELPPDHEPQKYFFRVIATDKTSSRVSLSQELIVGGKTQQFLLKTQKNITDPGEEVVFSIESSEGKSLDLNGLEWQVVRLEDQTKSSKKFSGQNDFHFKFDKGGSYNIRLIRASGEIVAQTSHWVKGEMSAPIGTIRIFSDREVYNVGDEASFLVVFDHDVDEALFTLERDFVDDYALLSRQGRRIFPEKISNREYRVRVKVGEVDKPNMIFSALSVNEGQVIFENKGFSVKIPEVSLTTELDKSQYTPRDKALIKIKSTFEGKPLSTPVSVTIVDEMIYVLQPDLSPSLKDFFWHPRRNQVRTGSSLDFHTYNLANLSQIPEVTNVEGRPLKMRERARREEKDTALVFQGYTDANGELSIPLSLPDSITRWRVTVRALSSQGMTGQTQSEITVKQPLYLKWPLAKQYREGDSPELRVIAFNESGQTLDGQLKVVLDNKTTLQKVQLQNGENILDLEGVQFSPGHLQVELIAGENSDKLDITLSSKSKGWIFPVREVFSLGGSEEKFKISAPHFGPIHLQIVSDASEQWRNIASDLLDYPYGCVEQNASRLIPLAYAYESYAENTPHSHHGSLKVQEMIRRRLEKSIGMLRHQAGADGKYGWWGDLLEKDPFFTAYASYALFVARSSLGMEPFHSLKKKMLEAYEKSESPLSLGGRALTLKLMQSQGINVSNLAMGVSQDLKSHLASNKSITDPKIYRSFSLMDILRNDENSSSVELPQSIALAALLTEGVDTSLILQAIEQAGENVDPFWQIFSPGLKDDHEKFSITLQKIAADHSTMERALALYFLRDLLPPLHFSNLDVEKDKSHISPNISFLGGRQWTTLDSTLAVKKDGSPHSQLVAKYNSPLPPASRLEASVSRQLFRLKKSDDGKEYEAILVDPNKEKLSTDEIYLDRVEVAVNSQNRQRENFLILEVPLPTGAVYEPTSFGISIPLENVDLAYKAVLQDQLAQGQSPTQQYLKFDDVPIIETHAGYSIPIATLDPEQSYYRLVRFNQTGHFVVPSILLSSMYDSSLAFEKGASESTSYVYQIH